jgi:hypothetical protein
VADGGSADRTVEIANFHPKVKVREFHLRRFLSDGSFMNPEPQHFNFLLDWGMEYKPDWLIFDDCDSWPGKSLQSQGRTILRSTNQAMVCLHRIYLWGEDKYLPKMNAPGQSSWAWRPDRADRKIKKIGERFSLFQCTLPTATSDRHILEKPLVLLHHFAPNEKVAKAKIDRYKTWGEGLVPVEKSMYWPAVSFPKWLQEEMHT